ncbi:hypothetical protein BGZ65_011250 [Modicella reniformis]|uniref:Uncharacterized protein n=1 Tax=Modicella reniformis TaxID=1440133 RepID=A0A9P6MAM9_9FUNG|nr:hypothetical protein BGZ65_011250 [Modicella reniformis]
MKQYTRNPHKSPADRDTNNPAKKAKKTASSSTRSIADDELDKKLVRAMSWQHPTVTLEVGTLAANVKRVLSSEAGLSSEVVECLQEASQAAAVKRNA